MVEKGEDVKVLIEALRKVKEAKDSQCECETQSVTRPVTVDQEAWLLKAISHFESVSSYLAGFRKHIPMSERLIYEGAIQGAINGLAATVVQILGLENIYTNILDPEGRTARNRELEHYRRGAERALDWFINTADKSQCPTLAEAISVFWAQDTVDAPASEG